jgi:arginine exporter protein ArgO
MVLQKLKHGASKQSTVLQRQDSIVTALEPTVYLVFGFLVGGWSSTSASEAFFFLILGIGVWFLCFAIQSATLLVT